MEQFVVIVLWMLGQGFVVSQVVDFLKRSAFVQDHPKLVAAVLNLLGVGLADLVVAVPGEVLGFIAALMAAFSASVASHEVTDAALGRE
ncbi:MAG: hypothetical protein ACRDHY_14695 [Anaerolineales bacterium]